LLKLISACALTKLLLGPVVSTFESVLLVVGAYIEVVTLACGGPELPLGL